MRLLTNKSMIAVELKNDNVEWVQMPFLNIIQWIKFIKSSWTIWVYFLIDFWFFAAVISAQNATVYNHSKIFLELEEKYKSFSRKKWKNSMKKLNILIKKNWRRIDTDE